MVGFHCAVIQATGKRAGLGLAEIVMKLTTEEKAFNATPEGQRKMCMAADSIGTALYINRVVKSKGGTGWDEKMIETANPIMLRAIKENLIEEFNGLVK